MKRKQRAAETLILKADTPATVVLDRRYRWVFSYVRAASVLFPLAILSALNFTNQVSNISDRSDKLSTIMSDARTAEQTRSHALAELQEWGADNGFVVLGWDGSEYHQGRAKTPELKAVPPSVEHRFLVASTVDKTQFVASLLLVLEPGDPPQTLLPPYLSPVVNLETPNSADVLPTWLDDPQFTRFNPTEAVTKAVQLWSEALISGDADRLRLATGDGRKGVSYTPITGPVSVEASVRGAAKSGKDLLTHVVLTLKWGSDREPTQMSADVLVGSPNTEAPVVVAWGPPGSGPVLERYENSTKRSTKTPTPATSTTTSTTTTTTAVPAPAPAPVEPVLVPVPVEPAA